MGRARFQVRELGGLVVRLSLTLVAASLFLASEAHAQNDRITRGRAPAWVTPSEPLAVPDDAGGAIFVRRQDFLIHLTAQGQEQYFGYRIRILHANALQAGNVSLAWNPAAGAPTVHSVKVYRGGETIDVLQTTSFEILRREEQLEAARLDGLLTAVLRVPDLRVGDELEVEMTTLASDPSLATNDAGVLLLAPSPGPGRYHLGLSWDKNQKPGLKISPKMKGAALYRESGVDFRFDNPEPLTSPKDAPARYERLRTVEYSDFADWRAVSRHFAPLYKKAVQLPNGSPIRREAARIAAAHATPLDRARAALKLVQQDVRYIYVGLNGGNLTPATAEETWQRRYGDCKGKTALLMALLSELGIEAEPVLVNSSGADAVLNERLPSPGLFDHVVVRARVSGRWYWLDGTLPPVASPTLTPIIPFEWFLPLTAQGHPLEQIEWKPARTADEIILHEIDARAGFDKPARITGTTIARGVKGLQAQLQFSSVAPAQMLAAFRQELVGNTWQAIDDVKWRYDEKAAASVLTISGTGIVDWDDDGNGEKSLALPGGGFNPPEKRLRTADQDQTLPFYTKPEFSCHATTVRLPTSTQAKQWSSKASFDTRMFGRNYYRAFELRDGAIRMVRGSRVEQREIDAATAKRDNERIAAFDNSMGWISYDPAGERMSVGNGQAVPATFEYDWTREDAPCTSGAARN
ncbi:MAG TPA: DUF3857 domain-containing protein [Allosphingosinicella sp.]